MITKQFSRYTTASWEREAERSRFQVQYAHALSEIYPENNRSEADITIEHYERLHSLISSDRDLFATEAEDEKRKLATLKRKLADSEAQTKRNRITCTNKLALGELARERWRQALFVPCWGLGSTQW